MGLIFSCGSVALSLSAFRKPAKKSGMEENSWTVVRRFVSSNSKTSKINPYPLSAKARQGMPTTASTTNIRPQLFNSKHSNLTMTPEEVQELDQQHVWHPYAPIPNSLPCFPVKSAAGCNIHLMDGRTIVDGMSSWWACVHGYNHPVLNQAARNQIQDMSHIMFGGLTHEPAVNLATALATGIPSNVHPDTNPDDKLEKVFFCDSGSVAIEVAMKMALQYQYNLLGNSSRSKFVTIRGGYHGDTFEAMSVCDPVNGMHHLFSSVLPQQIFCRRPGTKFCNDDNDNNVWDESEMDELRQILDDRHSEVAAVILEPVVQGAGGMRFYHPMYLTRVRELCNEYGSLLIFDEIATGFGRTGKMFAMEHAPPSFLGGNNNRDSPPTTVLPDILCIGKALSGGFMSFAATMTSEKIANVFSQGPAGVLMHGPTFMGNPLACAVSLASWNLLQTYDLPKTIGTIEQQLKTELEPCKDSPFVEDVRVLGAIGVVEMKEPMDMKVVQPELVNDHGVWLRPFGKLLYTMPPFIIEPHQLRSITRAMVSIATRRPR